MFIPIHEKIDVTEMIAATARKVTNICQNFKESGRAMEAAFIKKKLNVKIIAKTNTDESKIAKIINGTKIEKNRINLSLLL